MGLFQIPRSIAKTLLKLILIFTNGKIFTTFWLFLKVLIAILLTIVLPFVIFVMFLFLQPREIIKINDYITQQVLEKVDTFTFDKALISIGKEFDIVYAFKNVKIITNNVEFNLPQLTIKLELLDLLQKKITIKKVNLSNIDIDIKHTEKNIAIETTGGHKINADHIANNIYKFFDFISTKTIPIKTLALENSKIIIDNNDPIYLNYAELALTDYLELKKDFNLLVSLKLNKESKSIIINHKCNLGLDKNINCEVSIFGLYLNDFSKLSKKYKILPNHINNIQANFDLVGQLYLKDYTKLDYFKFNILSKEGFFNFKDIFGGKIDFNNLILRGEVRDNFDNISIKEIKANLIFDNNITNFSLSLEKFKNKNNIDELELDIYLKNAPINKLEILWPVFLPKQDLKAWVVENIRDGIIENSGVKLIFKKINNEFDLDSCDSLVKFKNANLSYANFLPKLYNVSGEAKFTHNSMDIKLDSAKIDKTKLKNGRVFLDFNDPESNLIITGNSHGPTYELLYFVDNNERTKIKNITEDYFNGLTQSNIKVILPLALKKIDLKNVSIDVRGQINNNTVYFDNNSKIKFGVKKDKNSNIFKTNFDFTNSNIYFPFLGLNKQKGILSTLYFDINVSNKIFLNNISSSTDSFLNLDGNVVINNGLLESIRFDKIQFNNTYLSLDYRSENEKNIIINIYGGFLNLINEDLKQSAENFKKIFINAKDNPISEKIIDCNINFDKIQYKDDLFLNKINIFVLIKDSKLNNIGIKGLYNNFDKIVLNSYLHKDKYNLNLKIHNIGNFLNKLEITNKLIGGNLKIDGTIDNKNKFRGHGYILNNFNVITDDSKQNRFIRMILENEIINKKLKESIINKKTIVFKSLESDLIFNYKDNILKIKNLIAFGNFIGYDLTTIGKININTGNIDLNGLAIPAGVLNRLIFIDKIPLLNDIILGGKNSGIFNIKYSFYKENYNSDFKFELNKSSLLTPGVLRKLFEL